MLIRWSQFLDRARGRFIPRQVDAGLGEAAKAELDLEWVAEEAAEVLDQDHIEGWRPGRRRVDHALKLIRLATI
jgi:hypothetical protein